jgi:hypothetical protein
MFYGKALLAIYPSAQAEGPTQFLLLQLLLSYIQHNLNQP